MQKVNQNKWKIADQLKLEHDLSLQDQAVQTLEVNEVGLQPQEWIKKESIIDFIIHGQFLKLVSVVIYIFHMSDYLYVPASEHNQSCQYQTKQE